MTKILKTDAKMYAEFVLTEIKRKRRVAMFNQARKYHKYLPAKWAMRFFKWFGKSSLGYYDYETIHWNSKYTAEDLLQKCCVEYSDFIYLTCNETELICEIKKRIKEI